MKTRNEINARITLLNNQVHRLAKLYVKRHECPAYREYHKRIAALQAKAIDEKQKLYSVLLTINKIEDMPEEETQEQLKHAINSYGFLMQNWEVWRTGQLAERMRQVYDINVLRHCFYYWLLLINSDFYSPFQKLPNGTTRQI